MSRKRAKDDMQVLVKADSPVSMNDLPPELSEEERRAMERVLETNIEISWLEDTIARTLNSFKVPKDVDTRPAAKKAKTDDSGVKLGANKQGNRKCLAIVAAAAKMLFLELGEEATEAMKRRLVRENRDTYVSEDDLNSAVKKLDEKGSLLFPKKSVLSGSSRM